MIKLLIFFFSLTFFNSAWAQSQGPLYERPRTARSLGMGGMFIPIVNDTDALLYNPAALAKVQGINFHLIEAGVSANGKEAYDIYKDLGDLNDPNTYNGLFGKRLWAEVTGKTAVAVPYFGFGYYTDYDVSLELHNPGFPTFETYFKNDAAIMIGNAFALGPNAYGGVAVKRIDRWGGETIDLGLSTIANADDLKAIGDNFDNKGQGYGLDLAVMTDIEGGPLKSTLALVWQDVGSTAFTKTSGADAPPRINQNLSFGYGAGIDLPGLDWMFGIEGRHLLEPEIQIGKKVHIGTELSLPLIDVRAGINQGYVTYGAGLNLFLFRIDAAVYTEELGVYPGQTAEERYMVSLSIDLSFDANFKFTDNNGKKRKLKQRR
jgi:hypothetical protein